MRRLGRAVGHIGIAALGILVALVLAEAGLRLSGLAQPGGVATMSQAEFERLPGIYAPNQRLVSREHPELPHRVSIDSLGYRGVDFPRTKAPGELRVFFTGDSFTYGSHVDDSVTVPYLVERRLAEHCAIVRVINGGLGGSTIRDQTALVDRALMLQPDVVILMFSENDITDLGGQAMWARLEHNRVRKSRVPLRYVYPALRSTALWNLLLKARARLQQRSTPSLASAGPGGDGALRVEYERQLVGLRDTLAQRGIPLLLAIMPTHFTVDRTFPDDQVAWMARLGPSLGIPTVSLLEPMRLAGRPVQDFYLLPHDGHTSAAGNHLAASEIASALRGRLASCDIEPGRP